MNREMNRDLEINLCSSSVDHGHEIDGLGISTRCVKQGCEIKMRKFYAIATCKSVNCWLCRTLQEALDMAKDDSTICFKTGYYAWKTPIEVHGMPQGWKTHQITALQQQYICDRSLNTARMRTKMRF